MKLHADIEYKLISRIARIEARHRRDYPDRHHEMPEDVRNRVVEALAHLQMHSLHDGSWIWCQTYLMAIDKAC